MRFTSDFLSALAHQGVSVSLVGGKIKVVPRHLVTDKVRQTILQHKPEIIKMLTSGDCPPRDEQNITEDTTSPAIEADPWDWLRPASELAPCYAGKSETPSCFTCAHYDGKGASWPGMCCYPQNLGRVALEIDWNVVDPAHGCGCYNPDVARITARDKEFDERVAQERNQCLDGPSHDDRAEAQHPLNRESISPVALTWLLEHRQQLKTAGWTVAEIYRRNKSRGIAWCGLWEQPFLKVTLLESGVIEFEAVISGKDIVQTARPMKQARKLKGDKTK